MIEPAAEVLFEDQSARVLSLRGDRSLVTPTYFPAVSGTGTTARLADLTRLVLDGNYPRLLLSAYDVTRMNNQQKSRLLKEIRGYRERGNLLFLDSGVFESFWFDDHRWNFDAYAGIARKVECDFYAAFDGAVHSTSGRGRVQRYDLRHITNSRRLVPGATCVSIVHGTTPQRLAKAVGALVRRVSVLESDNRQPPMTAVAVPERECGANVVERARTIAAIRASVNDSPEPTLLHVLGCGHPLSLAAYVSAGADSFDSIDWSRVALDWRTRSFTDLALLGTTGCTCDVCKAFKLDSLPRTLPHNLRYYQTFCLQLQRMVKEQTLGDFLMENLGPASYRRLRTAVREGRKGRWRETG